MQNIKKIFTYVFVGALVTALFISCGKNPEEPETEGNSGADSIPTFTGNPATDLPNGYYQGNLPYKSHHISDDFQYTGITKEQIVEEITNAKTFCLKIANNKLKWGENELEIEYQETIEKEALKSGSEYGATIEDGQINGDGSYKAIKTVKFTISDDGNSISITYIEGESVDMNVVSDDNGNKEYVKYSYDATYEGTLTNYTPTTTPSGS